MGKWVTRRRNVDWAVWESDGGTFSNEQVNQMLLMDIRTALLDLGTNMNALLAIFRCPNAQEIPAILRRIDENTKRRKPKRKVR